MAVKWRLVDAVVYIEYWTCNYW